MIVVRRATPVDAHQMGELWYEWSRGAGNEDPDMESWISTSRRGIQDGSVLAVVAQEDTGRLVGFTDGLIGYEPGPREVFLAGRHIYLTPRVRGQGLGERMQIRLLALANQSGAGYMLTHGTPSGHAFEKLFGIPMTAYGQVRIARWARSS